MTGIVIKNTGSLYTVQSDNEVYFCTAKGKLRLKGYKSTNPITIGDVVDFEVVRGNEGAIINIHGRKKEISRKSTNLSRQTQTMATNVDQVLFIYTYKNPQTATVFLDRFLVTAEYNNLQTIIIVNKIDIYSADEIDKIADFCSIYDEIGYKIITASIKKQIGIDKIKDILKDKSTYIVGLSGTGKSSLINALVPDANLKTAEISTVHNSGKHTTTFAEMLKLPFGGSVIDSPGIRAFGLIDIKKEELWHYFPEFFEIGKNCKFYNCQHLSEPQCAVKQAVEDGIISLSRYKSYLNIYNTDENKHR